MEHMILLERIKALELSESHKIQITRAYLYGGNLSITWRYKGGAHQSLHMTVSEFVRFWPDGVGDVTIVLLHAAGIYGEEA